MEKTLFLKSLIIVFGVYFLSTPIYAERVRVDLTFDMFKKIQLGMTYDEAVDIIGTEGELFLDSSHGQETSKGYQWFHTKNKDTTLSITVINDKIFQKIQSGLNHNSSIQLDLTAEMFEKIQDGMSYDEIVSIIGTEGEFVQESTLNLNKIPDRTYLWVYKTNGVMKIIWITFNDDKMHIKQSMGFDQGSSKIINRIVPQ